MWLMDAGAPDLDTALNKPLTYSYYLLSAKVYTNQPKVVAFRNCLLEEARISRSLTG